jgi:predicted lipoprotein with Yx(FWY)xxD motif
MTNFKTLSVVFAVLAIVFIASTGYLVATPKSLTSLLTTVQTTAVGGVAVQTTTVTVGGVQSSTSQSSSTSVASGGVTVALAFKPALGTFLTNASGWTLYLFTNDTQNSGTSSCYGQCATFWPAFHGSSSSLTLPQGVNASSFGTIARTDGTKQLTYQGWPLYFFAGDKAAGDTNGQGKFGTWFVVNIPKITIPSTTVSTSSG